MEDITKNSSLDAVSQENEKEKSDDKDSSVTITKHLVEMPHNNKTLKIDKNYKFGPANKFTAGCLYCLWYVLTNIIYVYNKAFLGLKIVGKDNFKGLKKQKTGIITVSNHMHVMDSPLVASCLYPYKTQFTSIESNFTIPVIGKFIKAIGVIPIPNDTSKMRYFFSYVDSALKKGNMLHFFPEGVLIPYDNELREFERGAFMHSQKTNCPILPIVLCQRKATGPFKFLKKHGCSFTAYILEPQYIDGSLKKREAVAELENRVYGLMKQTLENNSDRVVEIKYGEL